MALLVCAVLSGCHRRGYTDLYVESMASEIRDLEDQLYEYDHEYRLLEQELESLRRHNASLRASATGQGSNGGRAGESVREALPAPRATEVPELLPPSIIMDEPTEPRRKPDSQVEELPPASLEAPGKPAAGSRDTGDFDFNAGDLMIPTINTGATQPPSRSSTAPSTVPPEQDLELNLSRIDLPAQLVSASTPGAGARISPANQVVTDKRVVELAFHPGLSRSINFDDDDNDDGLYLVLQPKNQHGQVVVVPAALVVEVLDPGREEGRTRIGHWKYSPTEVSSKIQPLGSQQGIHLTLPWNGPNPKSDRVLVIATYAFENGRQVIAQKEIYTYGKSTLKTVWAPRASRTQSPIDDNPSSSVLPAAAVRDATGSARQVQPLGAFSHPDAVPTPDSFNPLRD